MSEPAGRDDATLATAVAAGDVPALGEIYDRYAPRLLGFCRSMLHNTAEAEDCLQDVFVIAATRLGGLREPELLRSWLFSVARHECLGRLDRRRREVLVDEVTDRASDEPEPAVTGAGDAELAALLRDAQAGMSDRDRLLLELADRQQLSGEEFAAAIGVPRATAYTLLARARTTAKKSIGALLVARTGREQCPELDTMLGRWDGELTPLLRKQVARHIEKCSICDKQRSRVASMAALLGGEGEAFAARLVSLRRRILDAAAAAMQAGELVAFDNDGWPPADPAFVAEQSDRRRRRLAGLLIVAIVLLFGGIVAAGAIGPLHHTTNGHATLATDVPTASAVHASAIVTTSHGVTVTLSSAPPTHATHTRHHKHGPSTSGAPSTTPGTSLHPTHPVSTAHSTHPTRPAHSSTPTTSKPSKSHSKSTPPSSAPPSSAPPSTTPPSSPPPPTVWVMTVQPSSQDIVTTWGNDKQTCSGSRVAVPPPCSYDIDDGTPVTIDIGSQWRFDSPTDCTNVTTGVCSLTMDADKSVTVHVS